MKRLSLVLLSVLALQPVCLRASDSATDPAAAIAAQRDSEERFKRLAADVQSMMETQDVLQRRQEELRQRLDRLSDEIRGLKEEQTRSAGKDYATRDDLKKYVEKLKEIDDKREADKKLILENIKELAKAAAAAPPPEPKESRNKSSRHRDADSSSSEEAPYLYTVQPNERLLDIIAAYNKRFQKEGRVKLTKEQVLKANPRIKGEKLLSGMTIRIPVPPKENQ